jgi:hypothetical protein
MMTNREAPNVSCVGLSVEAKRERHGIREEAFMERVQEREMGCAYMAVDLQNDFVRREAQTWAIALLTARQNRQ